jgi:hypothetical protein
VTFTAQQMRDFVRVRAYLLQAGRGPGDPLVALLRRLRDEYLESIGVASYLSQMLGECATVPVGKCILGWESDGDDRVLSEFNEPWRQVQRYLRAWYGNDLPYVVEVHEGDRRVAVKYL